MNWIPIIVVAFCSLLGSVGQLFLKQGADTIDIYKIGIGVALYGIAFVMFTVTLRFGELSTLYPVLALSYLFVLFISAKFLGETVTIPNYFGAFLIIFAVYLTQI